MDDNYWEDRFQLFQKLFASSFSSLLIADIGCGTGGFSVRVANKNNFLVFCDYGKTNVRATARRLKECGLSKTSSGVVADARQLPFKSNIFDLVACLEVLEHVGEDHIWRNRTNALETTKATEELNRIVKRYKPLFVLVPNKIFLIEVHSKLLFGNFMPFLAKKLLGPMLLRLRLSGIDYIPDNFTKDSLTRFFKGMQIERIGLWARHIPLRLLGFVLTINLPSYGIYLVARKMEPT